MKEQVAQNEFYTISVDRSLNRLYIAVRGFWSRMETLDLYAKDQTRAVNMMKGGYTLIADIRELKTMPPELVPRHRETQDELIRSGVFRVAEIMPQSAIANMQMKGTTNANNMPRWQFATTEEGEEWLNSQAKIHQ